MAASRAGKRKAQAELFAPPARTAARRATVSFAAAPGDVSLHYGDTMHAAPPPERDDLDTYRISAVTGYTRPGAHSHRGRYYNEVLHRREDGQIEHLSELVTKG